MPVPLRPVKAMRAANIQNLAGPARVVVQSVSPASLPIRWFEPVVLASGLISRADNASTALYGFAVEPSIRYEPAQIVTMPYNTDKAGNKRIGVYVFGSNNEFTGPTTPGRALTQADIGAACDLAPALASPTPVITQAGTGGAATVNYQVTAKNLLGESKSIAATSTTTSNATLSATNYNVITIPATTDAVAYVIYKGGVYLTEVPANPGTTTVFNDTGAITVGTATPPAQNDSGWVIAPALSSTAVIRILRLLDPVGTVAGRVIFTTASGKSQFTL